MRSAFLIIALGAAALAGGSLRAEEDFPDTAEGIYEDLVRGHACAIEGRLLGVIGSMPDNEGGRVKIWVKDARKRRLTQLFLINYDDKGKIVGYLWAKEATFTTDPKERQVLLHMKEASYLAADESSRLSVEEKIFTIQVRPVQKAAEKDPSPPAPPEGVTKPDEKKERTSPETPIESSPFAMAHDFGKLKYETKASHAFCIVNSSDVPLRVVSVRASSANHLRANMSKLELQPGEEGKLEISIDTRYFVGRKTTRVFLILQHGDKRTETYFSVTAESIKDLEP
jgi:hypothetical protein